MDDIKDSDMHQAYSKTYSTPLYESLIMGAWVLNFHWITDSINQDEILREEEYQVRHNGFIEAGTTAINIYSCNYC